MACNATRIELSNSAVTTLTVTLTSDPGDGTTVLLIVDGLGITTSGTTSGGSATLTPIAAVTADTNSLWDAVIQVGTNRPAIAEVLVTETNTAQSLGITITDSQVTYCAPTSGGGGVSDHGALTGLGDDDHTQYALTDGTRGAFDARSQGSMPGVSYRSIAQFLYPSEVTSTDRWYSQAWWSRKGLFSNRRVQGQDYAFITFGSGTKETSFDGVTIDWNDESAGNLATIAGLSDAQFQGHCDLLVADIKSTINSWATTNIDYAGMNARNEVLYLDPEYKAWDQRAYYELGAAYLYGYANGPSYSIDFSTVTGLYWQGVSGTNPTSNSKTAILYASMQECVDHARRYCNRVSWYTQPARWFLNDIRLSYDATGNSTAVKTAISTAIRNWSGESETYTGLDRTWAQGIDVWNTSVYNAMFAFRKEYLGALADGLSEYTTAKHYAIWLSHYAWGQTLNDSTQRNPWSFFGWSTEAGADDYTTTHIGSRTFTRFPMPPGVYNWAQARFLDNGIGVVVFWTPNEYGREAFVGTDVDDMNFSGVGTAGAHTFGTSGDADYMWDNVLSKSLGLTFSAQVDSVNGETGVVVLTGDEIDTTAVSGVSVTTELNTKATAALLTDNGGNVSGTISTLVNEYSLNASLDLNDLNDVNVAQGAGNDGDLVFYDHAAGAGAKFKGVARSSIGLSEFNDDLPAVQDSYLMLIESPTDKTYIIDGRVAAGRTVTNFYAKTSSGTCTATLKNASDTPPSTIGTISVTSTGGSAASLSNTAVTENERLSIEISSNSSAADLELVVEYTQ
jgi:hypothetical protein